MASGILIARNLYSGISASSDLGIFTTSHSGRITALDWQLRRIPLPEGAAPPRLPPILDAGAGVENFEVALEDVGGFSTNEVSVVLQGMS